MCVVVVVVQKQTVFVVPAVGIQPAVVVDFVIQFVAVELLNSDSVVVVDFVVQ